MNENYVREENKDKKPIDREHLEQLHQNYIGNIDYINSANLFDIEDRELQIKKIYNDAFSFDTSELHSRLSTYIEEQRLFLEETEKKCIEDNISILNKNDRCKNLGIKKILHAIANILLDAQLRERKKKLNKVVYPSHKMDKDLFHKHFEAGKILGLTEKEANFFAATAANYTPQERMNVTGIAHNGVGSIKRVIAKKIGLLKVSTEERDDLLKEIANKLLDPDNLAAARIAYSDDARAKCELLDEMVENRQLADMVRANPEMLQMFQHINQPQND